MPVEERSSHSEGAGLITGEIVAGQKDGLENRVIWIYPCVNDGNDSGAAYIKAIVGVREADYLGGRLGRIAVA